MQVVLRAKLQTQPAPSDLAYILNRYHYTKYLCKKYAHVAKATRAAGYRFYTVI